MIYYKEFINCVVLRARRMLEKMKEDKRNSGMSAHDIENAKFNMLKDTHMRPATVNEHREWVSGHLATRNGSIDFDHSGCYFPTDRVYILTKSISYIPKLCGSSAIILIVPKGINIPEQDNYGHSSILLMDGFVKLNGYCEIYKETLGDV